MCLYSVCIEDLLIKINLNKKIKGYSLNIIDNLQIKNKAYANDVTCFTQDDVIEIFNEFERWGNFSGSSVNKDKTQILSTNTNLVNNKQLKKYVAEEVKILGIFFNKFGVSLNNYIYAKEKLYKSLILWHNCQLDMIQRITALKTYIMSKIWFVLKFLIIEENKIKVLERDIFHFIWKGNREFISRKQIMKQKDCGGLNMFCLRTIIKSIHVKYFYDFISFYHLHEYQFCLHYFKIEIRDKLANFNLIPILPDKYFYKYFFL